MTSNHVDNVSEFGRHWLRSVPCTEAACAVADAMDALGNVALALETDCRESEDAAARETGELVALRRLRDAVGNFFYSPDGAAYERLERAFERVQSCGE